MAIHKLYPVSQLRGSKTCKKKRERLYSFWMCMQYESVS